MISVGHVKKMDGFFGLYRGLLPRILGGTVGNVVQSYTSEVGLKDSGGRMIDRTYKLSFLEDK